MSSLVSLARLSRGRRGDVRVWPASETTWVITWFTGGLCGWTTDHNQPTDTQRLIVCYILIYYVIHVRTWEYTSANRLIAVHRLLKHFLIYIIFAFYFVFGWASVYMYVHTIALGHYHVVYCGIYVGGWTTDDSQPTETRVYAAYVFMWLFTSK